MKKTGKWKQDLITALIMIVVIMGVLFIHQKDPITYEMFDSQSISYAHAEVTDIVAEDLVKEEYSSQRYEGVQTIKAKILTGCLKGQTVEIKNELSATHNVQTKPNMHIIVKIDDPQGVEPFYSVFNYDRTAGLVLMVGMFAVLMMLIGGKKGVRSMIGLAFAMFMIMGFLLPMCYQGHSPILMGLLTAVIIDAVGMLLLNGFSMKTGTAIVAVALGTVAAALLYMMFSNILHMSGFNVGEAEDLVLISQNTGLHVGQMLFTGILIASLGAVMDMTMSIASSLFELKEVHPELTSRELLRSGMHIGKDIIGVNCQTLILAFAGTAIMELMVLVAYGAQLPQLMNSDYMTLELMHALIGSMAVILAVPLTTVIGTVLITGKEHKA